MKISSNTVTLFSILFALLVLVACGSGGGGTGTNVTPPVVDPDTESKALLTPVANNSELLVSV